MKKLFYLFLIVGLTVVSCNKPIEITTNAEQEVSFRATAADLGFKSTATTTPNCDLYVPTQALITLEDDLGTELAPITVDIFMNGDEFLTQTFSLPAGEYVITGFVLTDDNTSGASLIYVVPTDGSTYGSSVSDALPINLTVVPFEKNELTIEVLCFNEALYELYGYTWFALDIKEINSFCFFGDICLSLSDNELYAADVLYSHQVVSGALPHDIAAIFEIRVLDSQGVLLDSFNNESFFGIGAPVCAEYPSFLDVSLELWVWVYDGTGFSYQQYYTWTIVADTDTLLNPNSSNATIGVDGFLDFVIGDCVPSADLIF